MTTNQKRQDKSIESGKWGPVGGEVLWEGLFCGRGLSYGRWGPIAGESCGRWGPVGGGVLWEGVLWEVGSCRKGILWKALA